MELIIFKILSSIVNIKKIYDDRKINGDRVDTSLKIYIINSIKLNVSLKIHISLIL